MKGNRLLVVIAIALFTAALAGCGGKTETPKAAAPAAPQANSKVVLAVKTTKAPGIDGVADDAWSSAQAVKANLSGAGTLGPGGNFNNGNTSVTVKALYDEKNLYMLYEWEDATDSQARGPWIKEGDKLVKKPYASHYEDKFAVLWNINDSTKGFNDQGCAVSCHDTGVKDKAGKPIFKHWTNAQDELLDTWHMKITRQNTLYGADKPGIMHDQFHDNVKFDPNNPKTNSAGRHSDPDEKEYADNITGSSNADPGMPKWVFDGAPVNGSKYVIVDGIDKIKPFTADMVAAMKEGDSLPGLIVYPQNKDAGDVKAKAKWANGKWTLEIQRPLKTDSKYDIQFSDFSKTYFFAMSAFDNSQIGHATMPGTLELKFKN